MTIATCPRSRPDDRASCDSTLWAATLSAWTVKPWSSEGVSAMTQTIRNPARSCRAGHRPIGSVRAQVNLASTHVPAQDLDLLSFVRDPAARHGDRRGQRRDREAPFRADCRPGHTRARRCGAARWLSAALQQCPTRGAGAAGRSGPCQPQGGRGVVASKCDVKASDLPTAEPPLGHHKRRRYRDVQSPSGPPSAVRRHGTDGLLGACMMGAGALAGRGEPIWALWTLLVRR
jgi:hypothetical protein